MQKTEFQNELRNFAEKELDSILSYWLQNAFDTQNGGIVGRIDASNMHDMAAPKGLILHARALYTFSAAYNLLKKDEYLLKANQLYTYIQTRFYDAEYGGYYWKLNCKGDPEDPKKQIYAQAFVMYGFSEYYTASGKEESRTTAFEIFELIEKQSFDIARNGYFEAFSRQWGEITDLRLSVLDMNEKKTMNTHLHIIEAYAALYKIQNNSRLEKRIANLLDIFTELVLNKTDYHFNLFFDENWNCKSDVISFGHDIEGSWLLYEAAEIIGDETYVAKLKSVAIKMAENILPAVNKHGGLDHDIHRGKTGDGEMEWWAQAEAVVGLLNSYHLSDNEVFVKTALKIKSFIESHFIDKKHGEWYYRIDKNLVPISHYDKVGFWKCPYHNSRMCIEIIKRTTNE